MIWIFLRKNKKKIYANIRNKNMPGADRQKKEYVNNYNNKRKFFLSHLINQVEELKNFSLNK